MEAKEAAEYGMQLAREIIALEAQIEEKREEFERLFGSGEVAPLETESATPPARQPAVVPKGATKEGSLPSKIKAFMATRPGKNVRLKELCRHFSDADPVNVRGETARLARTEGSGIENIDRGIYRYTAPAEANGGPP